MTKNCHKLYIERIEQDIQRKKLSDRKMCRQLGSYFSEDIFNFPGNFLKGEVKLTQIMENNVIGIVFWSPPCFQIENNWIKIPCRQTDGMMDRLPLPVSG